MRSTVPRWIASGFGLAFAVFLALYIRGNDPETSPGRFPPCLFRVATGFHCPGCGSARCAHALLNLDFERAWSKNAAFVLTSPLFLFLGFFLPWLRWVSPRGARPFEAIASRIPPRTPYLVLGLLILFGVLRNLPFSPFSQLAPG